MTSAKVVLDAIVAQGMLPLYFNPDESVSVEILRALHRSGVVAVEYTNRGDAALQNFGKLVEVRNAEMPGMLLGVGTIKNMQQASAYLAAGADFLVSPGYIADVAAHCVENDIFFGPGCMTPTDIIAAENAGIKFIKLFPGNLLGPEFMSSIKEIFPKLVFMPTGGVDTTRESIEGWFKAGVSAVGMGSKLVSKKLMESRDYTAIENNSRQVLELISSIKG